ncbi:MAG: AAA family ATPase [Thermoplasmata archaeon]
MILNKMELENIRSYRHEEVEFTPGIILFQGDIGSGKSSLLLALEFVLFGGTQQHFYDKILRHGKDSAWVKLHFQVDDIKYIAYRSIKRSSSGIQPHECYLEVKDTRMELSWREMRDKIDSLLKLREGSGFKVETFHMGIYIPQERMNDILSINDDQRLTSIRRVFNLEDYKRAVDNISILSRELKNEITKMETRAELLENSKDELEELKESREKKKKGLEDSKENLKDIKEKLTKLDNKLKKLTELDHERNSLKNKKSNLASRTDRLEKELETRETELNELKKQRSRLNELKEKKEEYDKLKSKLEKVKRSVRQRETIQRKHRALCTRVEVEKKELSNLQSRSDRKEELKSTIEEKKGLRKELKELKSQKRSLEKKISEVYGDMKSLEKERNSLLEEKKEILDLKEGAECPKCKQPISEEHVSLITNEIEENLTKNRSNAASLKEEKKEAQKNMSQLRSEIEKMSQGEKELYSQEKELQGLKGIEDKISSLEERIVERDKEVEELEKQIGSFEWGSSDLDELESRVDELSEYRDEYIALVEKLKKRDELEKDIKNIRADMEKTEEETANLEDRLEELEKEFSESEFEECRSQHRQAIAMRSQLQERIENTTRLLNDIKESIQRVEEKIEKMKDSRRKAREYRVIKSWIEGPFKESIRSMEEHRMIQINKQFENYFRSWFNEILDDPEKHARLDEQFAPIISTSNNVTRVDDLSGGERTSVALAYRLAFNTMIKEQLGLESNLLVLDEPTTGFSREQLTRLKDVLEKTNADQIIIVSHENEITNLAEIEYTIKKKDGVSRVQPV